MLRGFFGNLIFAIIARMLCGIILIKAKYKKKDVSRPRPLHFLAPPLFVYYFLWATFFNNKVFL